MTPTRAPRRWRRSPGYRVAGKTGTAQRVDPKMRLLHGKFTRLLRRLRPADNPRFVVYVVVQDPAGARRRWLGRRPGVPRRSWLRAAKLRRPADRARSSPTFPSRGDAGQVGVTGSGRGSLRARVRPLPPQAAPSQRSGHDMPCRLSLADVAADRRSSGPGRSGCRRHRRHARLAAGTVPATCTPLCREPAPRRASSSRRPRRPARSPCSPTRPARQRAAATGLPVLVVARPRAVLGAVAAAVYGEPAERAAADRGHRHPGQDHHHPARSRPCSAGGRTAVIGTSAPGSAARTSKSALTTPEAPDLHALFARDAASARSPGARWRSPATRW